MRGILKNMHKKLKSNKGFTLVEMLVALAIVVMMSLMMSVGASVGARVQREATFVAESDILASTLNTAVGDMLRYSTIYTTDDVDASNNNALFQTMEDTTKKYCLFDNDGYGISGGKLILSPYTDTNGRTAQRVAVFYEKQEKIINPTTHSVDGVTKTPTTHYLVSHGIYTTLLVENFTVEYKEANSTFCVKYTIKESSSEKALKKEVKTYFRSANETAPETSSAT